MRQRHVFSRTVISQEPIKTLPRLQPYTRCICGTCRECKSNAHWDKVFAKFEVKNKEDLRGLSRSPLADV